MIKTMYFSTMYNNVNDGNGYGNNGNGNNNDKKFCVKSFLTMVTMYCLHVDSTFKSTDLFVFLIILKICISR